ncbi:MAG: hypothetical protein J5694_02035 [Erysipelotrichaceae bacterium]|nr:hypothetical protein [Erysipelotrichaceae bacterium]MBO4537625.1 hypothetical protein [Erysipelotrichaceae bacterium]
MNKGRYYFLQFLLAAILLTVGLLIEIRSTATVEGAGALLLAVPGGVILLAMIIEFFKIRTKSVWHYVPVYLVLTLLAETAAIVYFQFYRYFGPRIVVLLLVVVFVTTAICQLFHYIHYVANKRPRII